MSKASMLTIALLLVLGLGTLLVNREFREAAARPAVQRLESQRRLRQFSDALTAYRQQHAAWPDSLFSLMKDQHLRFGSNLVRGGGTYLYREPPADAPADYVVMWSEIAHAGARIGEPWGGRGEVATAEHPPVSYVVTVSLRVEELDVDSWRRRAPVHTSP